MIQADNWTNPNASMLQEPPRRTLLVPDGFNGRGGVRVRQLYAVRFYAEIDRRVWTWWQWEEDANNPGAARPPESVRSDVEAELERCFL